MERSPHCVKQYVLHIPGLRSMASVKTNMSNSNFCTTSLFSLDSFKTKESNKIKTILVLRLQFNMKLLLSGITANFCRHLVNIQHLRIVPLKTKVVKMKRYVQLLGFNEHRSEI
jgi:hypothetical protein